MSNTTSTTKRKSSATRTSAQTSAKLAANAVDDAREKVDEAVDAAKERAEQLGSDLRDAAEGGYRQAAGHVREAKEAVSDGIEDGYRRASTGVRDAAREVQRQTSSVRSDLARFVDEHPLMVGAIGFAGGLLVGALLPRGRKTGGDDDRLADRLDDSATRWHATDTGNGAGDAHTGGAGRVGH